MKSFIGVAIATTCSACASFSPNEVAHPSKLTVAEAMSDIGTGFANLKKGITQNDQDLKTGLYPCKVTVSLNVTASADAGGELVIDTNIKPISKLIDATIDAKLDQKNTSSAQRSNNIMIEMYNPSCIPENTVGYNTPEKVESLTRAMEKGIQGAPFK